MSIDKNHSEQFKKYLNGEMSPKKANTLERKTLDDPFAQEALEGFENTDPKIAFESIELLQKKITRKSRKGIAWIRIAAAVTLLIVSSFALWLIVDQTESASELAVQEIKNPTSAIDSIDSHPIDMEDSKFIAEAEVLEESTIKKLKKNEVKIGGKLELVERETKKIEEELEPVQTLAEAANISIDDVIELNDESIAIALLEEADIEQSLQGRVAGIQIAKSVSTVNLLGTDSSQLDANLVTQPIIAQESVIDESLKKSTTEPASNKVMIRGQSSLARSTDTYNMIVTGKVTDNFGEALPGVNVIIKGTTTGTQTDLDGNYMLPRLTDMTLIYSFVGFESQEIEIGARTSIDVTLGGTTQLQEVAVTNYGISKKESAPSYLPAKPLIGNRKYNNYLKANLQYPPQAKSNEIEGTVVIELTISPNGSIANIDIKKSLGYGCDEEAIKLINKGPKWGSAKRDGVNVEDKVNLKVRFKLKRE